MATHLGLALAPVVLGECHHLPSSTEHSAAVAQPSHVQLVPLGYFPLAPLTTLGPLLARQS